MSSLGRKMGCFAAAAAGGALLGLVVLSILRSTGSRTHWDAGAPRSAPSNVIALLDGLKSGDRIGQFSVSDISVRDHRVAVDLQNGAIGFTVWVAKKGVDPHAPPLTTGRYALFFGNAHGDGGRVPAESYQAALQAIAARVRHTEARVPAPQGL
jgi:hypothetical protein